MTISLSNAVLSTPSMSKREKLVAMKRRQAALSLAAKEIMEAKGYVFGSSLRIPGTYAFEATVRGKRVRVGFKTSADRWLALPRNAEGEWGLLSAVDQVVVATFKEAFPRNDPRHLQIVLFEPSILIDMAKEVYALADKKGQTGMQWIPFDERDGDSAAVARSAGTLVDKGKLIAEERITWTSVQAKEIPELHLDEPNIAQEPPTLRLTIPQARAGLAAGLGVPPAAIKIIVES